VLGGRTVVFLSSMHAYKEQLVAPIRDRLNGLGYQAVIVEDEPLLRGSYGVESKVDAYIEASDAFVALCTHDDRVPGNTAQNIIEEIGRARMHPKLRDVVLVLKDHDVQLPSNVAPAWEPLDPDDPDQAFQCIRRQLETWEVLPAAPPKGPMVPRALSPGFLDELLDGVGLGDHEKAELRVRVLFTQLSKVDQRRVAKAVFDHVLAVTDEGDAHVPTSFLEAIARIDSALVPVEWIERLVGSPVVSCRMGAAMMLWDLADTSPGTVPIDLVARLAKPATEDWYVFAPAIGAAKQLALTRRSALEILLDLGRSADAEDRLAAVESLADLASMNAELVPMRPVKDLCDDSDESVAAAAQKLQAVILKVPKDKRGWGYRTFGL